MKFDIMQVTCRCVTWQMSLTPDVGSVSELHVS